MTRDLDHDRASHGVGEMGLIDLHWSHLLLNLDSTGVICCTKS
jgi:hypothetical protein